CGRKADLLQEGTWPPCRGRRSRPVDERGGRQVNMPARTGAVFRRGTGSGRTVAENRFLASRQFFTGGEKHEHEATPPASDRGPRGGYGFRRDIHPPASLRAQYRPE